jgi:hypothetical protein
MFDVPDRERLGNMFSAINRRLLLEHEGREVALSLLENEKAAEKAAFFFSNLSRTYAGRTFSACQPLDPLVTSNWTA